ncbi:AQG_2a_G0015740.mRNA.1.CDS.1 [Saccharomyces cerevisiae]|uniref:Anthranilate synthase component 1 n=6 Tax=Saccharomyces TaxID=4930 RepID=TRPE_YEAST|nr:anthranilate synthase TRP2 [Saccharomyces cerevisiae S288C]P00899.4 RecName: Full=Anthranilate synthase component 1; AltName: Full=Anthranilate synthase component I [Saccharomyces cerevisiae S288C]AAB64645.1 Trp2p: anthranilate synthase component I [Saccharomyces cerevisiae]AHY75652.1 Trp2p [Saccharomyces cerevisiae YJM993]AJP38361.1 Trp2p [Saccharomyces cerevisiae YJM1078]AJU40054.1 Trp2p [Saccharomyces cerevisiae YJM693]AJU40309.1 Trp2p [Saccharomyces cerevisiae YJM969]AJU40565.1 Trp2p |eukprot:NP_011014.1 anthranilate synthase TRP2 [Saccharomyces cerevisiae S288C]
MTASIKIQPDIDSLKQLQQQNDDSSINMYPVYAYLPSLDLTPHVAYLKLAQLNNPDRKESFLLESAKTNNELDRYSFIGISPRKTIKTGPTEGIETDPLEILEKEMSTFKVAENVPGLPKLSGGAIGYISYDCVRYFEPKTRRPLKDVLRLPEAYLMLCDTIIAFDNVFQRFQIIHNINTNETSLEEGYQAAAQIITDIVSKLTDDSSPIPYPEQPPIKLNQTFESNVGKEGYENHVSTLKKHIKKGDIIQGVPSQRVARPTSLHPFNIYRHLRTVNPSPYLFYIDCLDFQIIGASPELLCKSDSKNRVITHPIAGTVKRGATTEEDDALADQLRGSLKDRAEHVMLVDLARNDINRICDPLTTSVDKLLTIQKFSHVQHLVSQVSGVLRPEKTRFDAFRSIFPAGTVSGAPKVRAMELIAELEGERRGVYAGAVGHWSYDGKTMDNCIALRTMVYKDGIAYLQAGGGIVYDSDEYDEYVETMNKMMANHSTIVQAEELWADIVGSA